MNDPVELPEGATVRFEIAVETDPQQGANATFAERFSEIMGKARSLPEDAAV